MNNMNPEIVAGIEKANKAGLEAYKRLGEINLRAFERLTENQLELAAEWLEGGMKQFEIMGSKDGAKGIVDGQQKFAAEMSAKISERAKTAADVMNEARGEYAAWMEEGVESAAKQFEAAAKKTA